MTPLTDRVRAAAPVEFPTRIDAWLLVLVVGSLVFSLGAVLLAAREEPGEALLGLAILAASIGLVAVLSLPTRYTVGEDALVIRSGVLRQRIPLRSIRRVYPTRNPLAAPAWSLRRLGITYDRNGHGGGFALISPRREDEFLELLVARAGLVRDGAELRRIPD